MAKKESKKDHFLYSMVPGVVVGIVNLVLKIMEKSGKIESKKDWAPLGPVLGGTTMAIIGITQKNRKPVIIGIGQAAFSVIVLVVMRIRYRKNAEVAESVS